MAVKTTFALALLLCCASVALATNKHYECYNDHDCKTNNQCLTPKCNHNQCKYYHKDDGCACNDGNACTVNDKCYHGVCKPGHPLKCHPSGNPCKYKKCNKHTGQCQEYNKKNKTPCYDGNKCTVHDKCYYGQCKGWKKNCHKGPCYHSYCNAHSGACVHKKKNNKYCYHHKHGL